MGLYKGREEAAQHLVPASALGKINSCHKNTTKSLDCAGVTSRIVAPPQSVINGLMTDWE